MSQSVSSVDVEVLVNGGKAPACVIGGEKYVLVEKSSSIKVVVWDSLRILKKVSVMSGIVRPVAMSDCDEVRVYESNFVSSGNSIVVVMSSGLWVTGRVVNLYNVDTLEHMQNIDPAAGYDEEIVFPVEECSPSCDTYAEVVRMALSLCFSAS